MLVSEGFRLQLARDFFKLIVDRIYKRPEDVLREYVIDFWEADVEELHIRRLENGNLVFEGFGRHSGMCPEDLEAFFLLGTPYKRERKYSRFFGRRYAGEHGIGRLSAFKFYRKLHVESERDGGRTSFEISEGDLAELSMNREPLIQCSALPPTGRNYTRIALLEALNPSQIPGPERIRNYLSVNLFPILQNPKGSFKIFVNGEEVKPPTLERGAKVKVSELAAGERLEGEIVISEGPLPEERQGILLLIRGAPVCRRSLGELTGKRSLDAIIPPDRVTGYLDAPFLKPSASRDWVDESHQSFEEFKHVMARVAGKVERVLVQSEAEKSFAVGRRSLGEAVKILGKALRFDAELAKLMGRAKVNVGEVGLKPIRLKAVHVETQRRKQPSNSAKQAGGKAEGAAVEARVKELGLVFSIEAFADPNIPFFFYPPQAEGQPATFKLNSVNPLYVERQNKVARLRNYIILMFAKGITDSIEDATSENRNSAYSRIIRSVEAVMRAPLF